MTIIKLLFLFQILVVFGLAFLYWFFPLKFIPEVRNASLEFEIDPFIILGIIKRESNFNKDAFSHTGAFGLMQIMPDTAQWLMEKIPIQGSWTDPEHNVFLGSYYLSFLSGLFDNDLEKILTSYNTGQGNVARMIDSGEFKENNYSKRVKIYSIFYKILYWNIFN